MRRFQLFDEFAGPVTGEQVLKHGRHNQKDHAGRGRARSDDEIADLAQQRAGLGKVLDKSVVGEDGFGYVYRGERHSLGEVNPTGAARIIAAQGWDAPAQSVDQATFDRLAQRDDLVTVYRGGPVGLEKGMIEGTPYIGDGKNGPGTYVTDNPDRAARFADKWVETGRDESGFRTHDVYQGNVVPMLMPRSMFDNPGNGEVNRANTPLTDQGLNGVGLVTGFMGGDRVVWNTGAMIVGPAVPSESGRYDFAGRWTLDNVTKSVGEPPTDGEVAFYRIKNGEATPLTDSSRSGPKAIKFSPGLVPVLKHGRHDQSSHGRRGSTTASEEAARRIAEDVDYIMGRTIFPPAWSGGDMTTFVPSRSLGDRVQSARRKIREWKRERARRELARMTPAELERLGAANRAREAARRAARVAVPAVAKTVDGVYEILQRLLGDAVEPSLWVELIQDPRPIAEIDGPLGGLVDEMLRATAPVETVVKFAPGLRPVLKHGSHNQKDHAGKSGGAREVQVSDNESAWDAVLTNEARALDDRMKANPDRYNPQGQRDYGLKDGATETRIVRQDGPPRLRDYETNTSAGLTMTEAMEVEGSLGMAVSGYGKPLVPVAGERPPQHVYRVMSTQEFDAARERGYIKSDERMNLASGEGTVTSLKSTGSFYAPTDGSDYRVVRIKYADDDGWQTDLTDGYIKTPERVPFDRVDLYTSPVSQGVTKHLSGKHDQKTHGRGTQQSIPGTEGSGRGPAGEYTEWGDRAAEIKYAARTGMSEEDLRNTLYPDPDSLDPAFVREQVESEYEWEIDEEVEERMSRTLLMEDEDEVAATRERYREEVLDDYVRYHGDEVAARVVEESFDSDKAIEDFQEVYGGVYHEGVTKDGRTVALITDVTEAWGPQSGEDSIDIKGQITDADTGNYAGRFHRRFESDGAGGVTVTHELLEIEEEYQGTGFAKTFNRQAENYYISHGIDTVNVHAALDGGGYAWASQGFDWDYRYHDKSRGNMNRRLDLYEQKVPGIPSDLRRDMARLRTRLNDLSVTDPDYPTPKEIADLGRIEGVDTWPGKVLMRGSNWYGAKHLTPSGARQSTTERAAASRRRAQEAYEAERRPGRGQKTMDRDFLEGALSQATTATTPLFPPIPGVVE